MPRNAEITGESIDRAGDTDEFTFGATADGVYNVFVQSSLAIRIEVERVGGAVVATAMSQPTDTSLFAHATGQFFVTQAGDYIVRVSGMNPTQPADTGSYRLYLFAVDRLPEQLSPSIMPGDTISGEQIDAAEDIDEFTFSGSTGAELNLLLQAQNDSSQSLLQADVIDANGTVLRSVESAGTDTSLNQVTGRFALLTTGRHRVRIHAVQVGQYNLGAYRFFLYPVNRQPETHGNTLVFGDSISGEAIEVPGDVDEYRVTVPDTSGANLVVQLDSQARGSGLVASLITSSKQAIAQAGSYVAGEYGVSGAVRVPPGTYVLQVDGDGNTPIRGRYKVWLYRFSFGPEAASAALSLPDTVNNESINPPGDQDAFRFNGVRGEHINIALQGTASPTSNGGFVASLTMAQSEYPMALVVSPTSSPGLDAVQSLRFDLPATAQYVITVKGGSTPTQVIEHGSYRLAVTHVATDPEHVASALIPGDSVSTEPLDAPGDWDLFTVTATAGEELGLVFGTSPDQYPYYPSIVASNALTGDSLAGTLGQDRRFAGPFRVPSSGRVNVAVFERPWLPGLRECYDSTCGGVYRFTGAYQYKVIRFNRAPEIVGASYTVGDTVRGEAIDPIGDVDEFTATGTPGEQLTPFFRLTADPANGNGLTIEVINATTGSTLVGQGVQFLGASQQFGSLSAFTVPASGTFVVRIRGSGLFGDEIATAPYEFFIER